MFAARNVNVNGVCEVCFGETLAKQLLQLQENENRVGVTLFDMSILLRSITTLVSQLKL